VQNLARALLGGRCQMDTMAFSEWLVVDAHLRRTSQITETDKQPKPTEPSVTESPVPSKRSRRPRDVEPRPRPTT